MSADHDTGVRPDEAQPQVYENRPRTATSRPKDPQNLTDAEKLALYDQWRPFTANA